MVIESDEADKQDQLTKLRLSIKRSSRYRATLADWPLEAGTAVILAGDDQKFKKAIDTLQPLQLAASVGVCEDATLQIDGLPLVPRSHFPSDFPQPVIFTGAPRKFQFSSSREFGNSLRWLDGDDVPKKNSRLADRDIFRSHGDALVEVHGLLEDEASKATFRSIVASRYYNDNGYLRIARYREYQHPATQVQSGDVVVDGGAYVGKITRLFAKACGSMGMVYSFEPDPKNYEDLCRRNSDLAQVVPIKAGIWDESTTLFFDNLSGTTAGHALSEQGAISVPVVSLDDFFAEKGRRLPTVIKFDIEGAEQQGLAGAEKVIKEGKPRLMISAYHKPSDLWELLYQIRRINPDYKFYLGHHNFYHTETDIYAV